MNFPLIFFITIVILIIVFSLLSELSFEDTRTTAFRKSSLDNPRTPQLSLQDHSGVLANLNFPTKEGLSIDINKWDVSGMQETLNKLKQSGEVYTVNNFETHLDMLVNRFNVQYELDVLEKASGPESEFPPVDEGQCYRDNPYRYLPSYRLQLPITPIVENGQFHWYSKEGNYENCKAFAIKNGANTFGIQYGYECWIANVNDDNMNNQIGQGPINSDFKKIDQNACNRYSWPFQNGTGGGWSNMLYKKKIAKKVNRIKNYENVIREFIKSDLYSDEDVMRTNNFNMNTFTTLEGFDAEIINGIPVSGRSIKASDKINITNAQAQQTDIVTNNIIDIIVNNNYGVQTTNFHQFINKFKNAGKNIKDADEYIRTMKQFGVESETIANKMVERLSKYSSDGNDTPFHDILKLIKVYFVNYGIKNINAIFDTLSPIEENGWFTNAVESHKLNTQPFPLLPSTVPNGSTDSVMERLYAINKSIKTIGEDNMSRFFREFNNYNVNAASFFSDIYPIYTDPALKIYDYYTTGQNKSALSDALHRINGLSNSGLIAGFNTLKSLLGQNGLNLDFNSYVDFVDALKERVSYMDIIMLWNDFKNYYLNVSAIDGKQSPVTVNTIISWIDEINAASKNPPYFSNKEGDFNKYLKIITEKSYTTSRIKDDINSGQRYITFLNENEGFSTLSSSSNQYDIIGYLESFFYSLATFATGTEGMDQKTLKPSDAEMLVKFNITDFDKQLNSVKMQLQKYNLSQIDTNNTEWNNMINVIYRLTQLKITIQEFDNFIQLMVKFGATTIQEWYDVIDKLTQIKIESYANIKTFIELITGFNVRYNTNFVPFINIITEFKADLSKSLQSIIGFVGDMNAVGYKYDRNQIEVDGIVRYFVKCKYTLNTYKRNYKSPEIGFQCSSPVETNDDTIIGLPSLIVRSLYSYKSTDTIHNNLYDIQFPRLVQDIPYCNVIEAMHQAYILANNLNTYNQENAIISPNVSIIISFFYREEMYNIIKSLDSYTSANKQIQLMHGVSDGMLKYSNGFKNDPPRKSDYKLYTSIANFIRIFPALSFQYLSSEIISKCGSDANCTYYGVNVNPEYSQCKASTTNKTINQRPDDPVI